MKKIQPSLIQNMYEKLFLLLPTAATIGRQSKPARFMGCFSSILNGDSWRHFPLVGPELAKVGLKTSITIDITMEPVDIFERRHSTFNVLSKSSRLYTEMKEEKLQTSVLAHCCCFLVEYLAVAGWMNF